MLVYLDSLLDGTTLSVTFKIDNYSLEALLGW